MNFEDLIPGMTAKKLASIIGAVSVSAGLYTLGVWSMLVLEIECYESQYGY